jgi:hypothetical protein
MLRSWSWEETPFLNNNIFFFWNGGNKHCPIRLIKVSDFLGGNQAKTDTNGTKPPNNRQHTPKTPEHTQPTWLPTQAAHTPPKREQSSRLLIDVNIITPSRASDSDFIKNNQKRSSPWRPHEAHVGPCQTVDSSRTRLAAPILNNNNNLVFRQKLEGDCTWQQWRCGFCCWWWSLHAETIPTQTAAHWAIYVEQPELPLPPTARGSNSLLLQRTPARLQMIHGDTVVGRHPRGCKPFGKGQKNSGNHHPKAGSNIATQNTQRARFTSTATSDGKTSTSISRQLSSYRFHMANPTSLDTG